MIDKKFEKSFKDYLKEEIETQVGDCEPVLEDELEAKEHKITVA